MKKTINYLSYIIPTLIILFVSIYFFNIYRTKCFIGKIINIDNNYIEIITENDLIYKFDYKNKENNIGDYVKVKYNKQLNNFFDIQNVNIKEISLTSKSNTTEVINIINNMTLEEKIGQLLLARVPINNKLEDLKDYNLGGYILFQRDIDNKSKDEIISEIKDYQKQSKIPLIIAIDEEGGTVSRLNNNKDIVDEKFLSPQELFNKGGFDLIKEDAIKKSNVLKELGINMNLAPICDITTDSNSYMFNRSFGKNEKETSKYIKTIMNTQTKEVTYVLKHFPGYGNNTDTHTGISIDNRTISELRKNDFKPFITGIKNNAKAIMISHNINSTIDNKPSTLSRNIHNILREELNFDGLIITDDLSMSAIQNYNTKNPYLDAVNSGNNILIVSDYKTAYNEILNGIKDNIISEELINSLISKTIEYKLKTIY